MVVPGGIQQQQQRTQQQQRPTTSNAPTPAGGGLLDFTNLLQSASAVPSSATSSVQHTGRWTR